MLKCFWLETIEYICNYAPVLVTLKYGNESRIAQFHVPRGTSSKWYSELVGENLWKIPLLWCFPNWWWFCLFAQVSRLCEKRSQAKFLCVSVHWHFSKVTLTKCRATVRGGVCRMTGIGASSRDSLLNRSTLDLNRTPFPWIWLQRPRLFIGTTACGKLHPS
jgi:hypothetical protein